MSDKRRGHGEDSIYFDHRLGTECRDAKHHKTCAGRWRGVVSLGFDADGKRVRRKVGGRTKADVKDKLDALHDEMRQGVRSSGTYTVRDAVNEWLAHGLDGRSPKTISTNREVLAPLLALIGSVKLRELTAVEVRSALGRLAEGRSTRAVQMARAGLVRAIRHAEADDLVGRNVAALVTAPPGQEGRPSKALTLQQAQALLKAALTSRLHAYVMLCLLVGVRTEEARALIWEHVVTWVDDFTGWRPVSDVGFDGARSGDARFAIYVWRSDRYGGDTKTEKSRRTLALPQLCVDALREQWNRQARERAEAGEAWQEHGLVFASMVGTPLDPSHVRRAFKKICMVAGIGADWTPRELRHTFVSIMSEHGVLLEEIARLVGHSVTTTTETVYRRELRPVISTGAEVMDTIFKVG